MLIYHELIILGSEFINTHLQTIEYPFYSTFLLSLNFKKLNSKIGIGDKFVIKNQHFANVNCTVETESKFSSIILIIIHVHSIYFYFIISVIIVCVVEINVCNIGLIHSEITSEIVWPIVNLHKPKIVYLFPFLRLWCYVIARGNLENFVNAEVVIGKFFDLIGFLIELVEDARVKNLTDCMLWTCPAVLYVLEFGDNFSHLFSINGHVLIQKFFDTVGTEIQEYRYFL